MADIRAVHIEHTGAKCSVSEFGVDEAKRARRFHESFPQYEKTPLADLKNLASELGISGFYVKDESFRFGLNAFKVLGGSYAVGNCVAEMLGRDMDTMTYDSLKGEKLSDVTFVTATDGNHGRGIAWTAHELGLKSVVYMPRGSSRERLDNILALGSDASITDLNYDDSVRLAKKMSEERGWILTQDTSWEGYEKIPTRIMQGYLTMALEAAEQMPRKPTHIFLQAGVGSMSAAVTAFFADMYGDGRPIVTIVEPDKADCIFRTAEADDGTLHTVSGDMDTMMAGLACGEPCTLGWPILRDHADNFVSCPDSTAAEGMRLLAHPRKGDPSVVSGESGAVTSGLAYAALAEPSLKWLRDMLRLDESSVILCFSTEGATDRENYERIVGGMEF